MGKGSELQKFKAWFAGEDNASFESTYYDAKDAATSFAGMNVEAFKWEEVRRVLVQDEQGKICEYEVEIEIDFRARKVEVAS